MIKKLAEIANKLDSVNFTAEADYIDSIILKTASIYDDFDTEEDLTEEEFASELKEEDVKMSKEDWVNAYKRDLKDKEEELLSLDKSNEDDLKWARYLTKVISSIKEKISFLSSNDYNESFN